MEGEKIAIKDADTQNKFPPAGNVPRFSLANQD